MGGLVSRDQTGFPKNNISNSNIIFRHFAISLLEYVTPTDEGVCVIVSRLPLPLHFPPSSHIASLQGRQPRFSASGSTSDSLPLLAISFIGE